jgi:hypothetical protein
MPVRSLVELSLVGEHRRGHGSLYAVLDQGRLEVGRAVNVMNRFRLTATLPATAVRPLATGSSIPCRGAADPGATG